MMRKTIVGPTSPVDNNAVDVAVFTLPNEEYPGVLDGLSLTVNHSGCICTRFQRGCRRVRYVLAYLECTSSNTSAS
jgi:hypothetical protein